MYYLPCVRVPVLVCVHREVKLLCLCPTCSIGSLVPEELMTLIIFWTLLSTIKRLSQAGRYGKHHAVFAFNMCGFAAISWPMSCGLCLGPCLRAIFLNWGLCLGMIVYHWKEMNHVPHFKAVESAWCVSWPMCVLRLQQMCLPLWICTLFFNARFRLFAKSLQTVLFVEYLKIDWIEHYITLLTIRWMASIRAIFLHIYRTKCFYVCVCVDKNR